MELLKIRAPQNKHIALHKLHWSMIYWSVLMEICDLGHSCSLVMFSVYLLFYEPCTLYLLDCTHCYFPSVQVCSFSSYLLSHPSFFCTFLFHPFTLGFKTWAPHHSLWTLFSVLGETSFTCLLPSCVGCFFPKRQPKNTLPHLHLRLPSRPSSSTTGTRRPTPP